MNSTRSLSLDGVGAFVAVGGVFPFTGTGDITLSTWVKQSGTDSLVTLLYVGADVLKNSVYLYVDVLGFVEFGTYAVLPANVPKFAKAMLQDGNWHLVTGTKFGDVFSIYLDGVLQDSKTISGVNVVAGYVSVGAVAAGLNWPGFIDDVRIFNTAKNATAVASLYAGTDDRTGIIGYWPFEEGVGLTTADLSGNGNTGALTNGPAWSTDVPHLSINTRQKRNSLIGYGLPFRISLPVPDTTIDQGDRQHLVGLYSGILAAGPAAHKFAMDRITLRYDTQDRITVSHDELDRITLGEYDGD